MVLDPSQVDWEKNEPKRQADEVSFRHMAFDMLRLIRAKAGEQIHVLSFPGVTWSWEDRLAACYPEADFYFFGLEKDKKVFPRLVAATKQKPVQNYTTTNKPTSARKFITQQRRKFGLVYFDWMGTWSVNTRKDVMALLENDTLEVGGLLLMTIQFRRGYWKTNDELASYEQTPPCAFYDACYRLKYVDSIKACGVPRLVAAEAAKMGVTMTAVCAEVYYSDTGKGVIQPMLRILMRRDA